MKTYHKIQTVFLRDPDNKYKTLLEGQFSRQEFEYLANNQWEFTEKVDGTNIRVMWDGSTVKFGGKAENTQLHVNLVQHLRDTFTDEIMGKVFGFDANVLLYGEGCGAGIQKHGDNYYGDTRFVLFDVEVGDWWLRRMDVDDVALKLGIPKVPVVGQGTLADMVGLVSSGFESAWGPFRAEGVVARPVTELFARDGERIITKLKAKDFAENV